MIHHSFCPVCKTGNPAYIFSSKDHTVSQELFAIHQCNACNTRFTQDIPAQDAIGAYYASENYISHSDTKMGFINRLYHLVRQITLAGKLRLIASETRKGSILDVGCGTGAFLHTMQQGGWEPVGLEPDDNARRKAFSMYGIEAMPSDQIFNLRPGSFDAITMWHVLEHVHLLHEYIDQLKTLMTSTGKLFIAVPNFNSYDANVYRENWAAYDVPRHLYHFSPHSMKVLMNMHGLKVEKIKAMWFDSFYVSLLSEKYKNGKGNMVKAFLTGLL
jgi:2-polyprenyl-3-methyl-5-hydroxy-6-metoxy-1,4-benzoquinol methylase